MFLVVHAEMDAAGTPVVDTYKNRPSYKEAKKLAIQIIKNSLNMEQWNLFKGDISYDLDNKGEFKFSKHFSVAILPL